MNDSAHDRRESASVEATFRVVYPTVDELLMGYTQDLSRGGVFVETDEALTVGSVVRVTMVLPADGGEIGCNARVARVREAYEEGPGAPAGLVVEFLDMAEEDLKIVEDFITSRVSGESGRPEGNVARRRLLVLVVDDDRAYREMAAEAFRVQGHEVLVAEDGLQGLAHCLNRPPDIVLTDVQMPRMDGWNLLRTIRARPSLAKTLVIFETKLDGEKERLKGYQLGVDDYIAKPYRPEELVARLDRLISRTFAKESGKERSNALRGDLEQVSLATVLSMLEIERKTGVLLIIQLHTARIFVREGRPLAIELEGSCEGAGSMEMAAELMNWTKGLFEFAPRDVNRADDLQISMQGLLMEAARLNDEANR